MREALIDLVALKSNVKYLKERAGVPLLAVVKADAYGHGLIECSKAALEAGATYLGVALLEEAFTLRAAGVDAPIIAWLLPPGSDFKRAVNEGIELGLSSLAAFDEVNSIDGAKIHLEVDTGMGRGGFLSEWNELLARDLSKVVGVYSHFARADEPHEAQNTQQLNRFESYVKDLHNLGLKPMRHLSNTAATLTNSKAKYDMVRVGISMYGLSPVEPNPNLKPVMAVRAKLALVKAMPANSPIGYGAVDHTKTDTKIGIVSMGYADGIPRIALKSGVTFNGMPAPIIGRVSMDQFVVDLGANTTAKSGDWVTVIGEKFGAQEWADASHSVHYEITTRLGVRVPRVYKR